MSKRNLIILSIAILLHYLCGIYSLGITLLFNLFRLLHLPGILPVFLISIILEVIIFILFFTKNKIIVKAYVLAKLIVAIILVIVMIGAWDKFLDNKRLVISSIGFVITSITIFYFIFFKWTNKSDKVSVNLF